ncbi:MAG: TPM domain-containing protein [Bacteroidales bacterium]|nr:TPM domain-containing protein [Bacteroidales bacterium]
MGASAFLSKIEQEQIVKAIESAELSTSGEIRVHIESLCKGDPVERAVFVFNKLKMFETKERNGVLIYIALKSHKFAIIGDSGINEKVDDNFWDEERELLLSHLKVGKIADGLISVIEKAGNNLKKHFPYQTDDTNEQSNEISFGE